MKGKIVFLVLAMFIMNVRYMRAQNINSRSSDVLMVDMRKQPSVAFVGTYYNSLGPCERLQDGRTRRRNIGAFKINQDLLGNIKVAEIEIASFITPDSLIA